MENLDKFFDTYGRVTPRWFGDAVTAVLVLGSILWLVL